MAGTLLSCDAGICHLAEIIYRSMVLTIQRIPVFLNRAEDEHLLLYKCELVNFVAQFGWKSGEQILALGCGSLDWMLADPGVWVSYVPGLGLITHFFASPILFNTAVSPLGLPCLAFDLSFVGAIDAERAT